MKSMFSLAHLKLTPPGIYLFKTTIETPEQYVKSVQG